MKRTNFILRIVASFVFAFTFTHSTQAQSIAFTFDDGPKLERTPLLTPAERNAALLDALTKHDVKATLFVTTGNGADKPEGLALAKAWGDRGHTIGNHTVTHLDLNSAKVSLEQYQQEVLACDKVISALPGYKKWFRFTYLREGNTPEKIEGMRDFLKAQDYRNAYVSLDTSNWRLDEKLVEVLTKNPTADVQAIKQMYLAHLWHRAQAYRALSQKLQGRDIAQVILLHHNLINALWLDDVIALFKSKGWSITAPQTAFDDPVYQFTPARPAAGQSLLLGMARSLGLNNKETDKRLFDDAEFEINALKSQGF
jgi:peptidoglycan-N-acetylglucosamine deacetylase